MTFFHRINSLDCRTQSSGVACLLLLPFAKYPRLTILTVTNDPLPLLSLFLSLFFTKTYYYTVQRENDIFNQVHLLFFECEILKGHLEKWRICGKVCSHLQYSTFSCSTKTVWTFSSLFSLKKIIAIVNFFCVDKQLYQNLNQRKLQIKSSTLKGNQNSQPNQIRSPPQIGNLRSTYTSMSIL